MTNWRDRAACKDSPFPAMWFSEARRDITQALEVCSTCEVTSDCAQAGKNEHYGIWGGVDHGAAERQRRHRWEKRHRRICDWCSTPFFWDAKPDVRPPAFCSDACEDSLRLARAAELYRQSLEQSA